MAGIQLPIGIDTVNPVPADFKYGPYVDVATAVAAIPLALRFDGLTVQITGLGNYWWLAADLSNAGLVPKGSFAPPIVRYVYLVQDASDAARMGGSSNNVYTTTQTAYDAANALQVLSTGKVIIKVGNTTSATVGNLVLTANHNTSVEWVGITANDSVIGTITGNFTTNARFSNMTVGSITTSTPNITLTLNNVTFGAITTTDGGNVSLILRDSTTGVITTTTTGATASGGVSLSSCSASTVNTITQNATAANVGLFSVTTCSDITIGSITRNQLSTTTSFSIGTFTLTNCDNIRFSNITSTMAYDLSTGTIGGLNIGNTNRNISAASVSILGHNVDNVTSDVVVTQITVFNTTFSGSFQINTSGLTTTFADTINGGRIAQILLDNCIFNQQASFGYFVTTPIVSGTVSINNCEFHSTTAYGLRFLWNEVTLTSFSANTVISGLYGAGRIFAFENDGSGSNFAPQIYIANSTIRNMILGTFASGGTYEVPNYHLVNCTIIGLQNFITLINTDEVAKLVGCRAEWLDIENTSGLVTSYSYIIGCPHIFLDGSAGLVPLQLEGSVVKGDFADGVSYAFEVFTSTLDTYTYNVLGTTYTLTGNLWTSHLVVFATATNAMVNNGSTIQSL